MLPLSQFREHDANQESIPTLDRGVMGLWGGIVSNPNQSVSRTLTKGVKPVKHIVANDNDHDKQAISLLSSVVDLLGRISSTLQSQLSVERNALLDDRENRLEHKNSRGEAHPQQSPTSSGDGDKKDDGIGSKIFDMLKKLGGGAGLAAAGGAILEAAPVVATVAAVGGVVYAGKKLYDEYMGSHVGKYEAGGTGTISSGKGDPGGKSYGQQQLSSSKGSLAGYVRSKESRFGREFNGLKIASPAFDAKWKQLAKEHPKEFAQDQYQYIKRTHYDPAEKEARRLGYPVGDARIREMLWSASIQHGGVKKIIQKAAAQPGFREGSIEDKIRIFYKVRGDYSYGAIKADITKKKGRFTAADQKFAKSASYDRYAKELKTVLSMQPGPGTPPPPTGATSPKNGTPERIKASTPPARPAISIRPVTATPQGTTNTTNVTTNMSVQAGSKQPTAGKRNSPKSPSASPASYRQSLLIKK